MHTALRWIIRKRRYVFAGTAVVCAVSIYGIYTIKVDNKMLEDLKDSHRLKQEFFFMEDHFSGCRPFEMAMVFDAKTNVYSPEVLDDLDTINQFLQREYGVGSLISVSEIMKSSYQALNAGDHEFYVIPTDSLELTKTAKFLRRKDMEQLVGLFVESTNTIRISGKVGDFGRQHYDSLNVQLDAFIAQNCQTKFQHHVTGTAHLIDLNNKYLVENMLWDLLLSVVVIGLVMGIVYKSPKMILLTIIPNMVPLIIVGESWEQ
ncbi:MAG: hypothetical protein IPP69_09830 [Flavobacteriales bacterium]|nr:hypothetical protein [Flavobacteriales bacterium]